MRKEVIGSCELYCGDCLEILSTLDKVDAVISDPPYGVTKAKWDNDGWIKPFFDSLPRYETTPVMLFDKSFLKYTELAREEFRYKLVYVKNKKSGFQYARFQPMRQCEYIAVFYKKQCYYKPHGLKVASRVYRSHSNSELIPMRKICKGRYCNYPSNVLNFSNEATSNFIRYHPTQKPIALMRFLAETWAAPNSVVLDPFMGSGTTGVACVEPGRRFIGIELNEKYFDIACKRIENAIKDKQSMLFAA